MKTILKYSTALLIVFVMTFYFWGSSGNLSEEQLVEIIQYESSNNSAEKDTFSIVTYNIGYLSGMTNNVAMERSEGFVADNLTKAQELINNYNPDFIGFQEIDFDSDRSYNVNQMEEIAKTNEYGYGAIAVNWDKNYVPFPYLPPSAHFSQMLSGQGVLSKYPIATNTTEVLVKPESNPFYYNAFYLDRLAQICSVDVNGKKVIIINVHLEAFVEETRVEHVKTVLALYHQYSNDHPVLLIGDFNSVSPFATNRHEYENDISTNILFEEEGLAVAIPEAQYLANEVSYFTFNSGKPNIKIDFIFYNEDKIAPLESKVLTEAGEISDHLPVWFKFVLK